MIRFDLTREMNYLVGLYFVILLLHPAEFLSFINGEGSFILLYFHCDYYYDHLVHFVEVPPQQPRKRESRVSIATLST